MAVGLVSNWDIVLMRMDASVSSVEVMSGNIEAPLGSRAEVLFFLEGMLPDANFSDPAHGTYHAPGYSFEFDLGDDDMVETLTIRLHGEDEALVLLQRICLLSGWRALNMSTGTFIDFSQSLSLICRRGRKPHAAPARKAATAFPEKKWWHFWKFPAHRLSIPFGK